MRESLAFFRCCWPNNEHSLAFLGLSLQPFGTLLVYMSIRTKLASSEIFTRG